ncbi:MAG: ATP-binding cassette domain-containing protein [Clostridiales bacterium]|nr:ATP-binding cassette domain-containing protein [Clostridiales bacterium]
MDFPSDLGIMIETPGFLRRRTGRSNLEILASLQRKISREQIDAAMCRVGLEPELNKPVSQYSLGMRQRLGIAQAIMEEPSLLILDEPMNSLDRAGRREMRTLFVSLRDEGRTILLASHLTEDIQTLCDTVCEMDSGILTELTR